MGIDISPECAHGAPCVPGALSCRCVCRDTHSCAQHTRSITQSPRSGYMCVDFPPAAQRDPGSHAPVDTATCINHTHSILHTWAPTQITVSIGADIGIGATRTRRHHRDCWTCLESGKYTVVGVSGTERNTYPHCSDTCG